MSKNNHLVKNTQDKNRKMFKDTPIHLPTYAPLGSLTDGKPVSVWAPSGMAISWPHEATQFISGCLANTVQHPFLFPEQHQLPLGEVLLLYSMWFWQDKGVVCSFSPSGFDFPSQARIWAACSPRRWSEVLLTLPVKSGHLMTFFMALQGLKAAFVFPSPSISS